MILSIDKLIDNGSYSKAYIINMMIKPWIFEGISNIEQDPRHLAAGSVGRGTRRFAFGTPWRAGRSNGTRWDDVVGTTKIRISKIV